MRTIADIARERPIVLSVALERDAQGKYKFAPDIYRLYGLCTRPRGDGSWENRGTAEVRVSPTARIYCGYIALSDNKVLLPGRVEVDGFPVDSFSFEIAAAADPITASAAREELERTRYNPPVAMDAAADAMRAGDLIGAASGDPTIGAAVSGRAVLVGGHWSLERFGSGKFNDTHQTPSGKISGVLIHQNFVETLLNGTRWYHPIPKFLLPVVELLFSLLALALYSRAAGPRAIAGRFAGLAVLLVLIQVVTLYEFAVFPNGVISLAVMTAYSLFNPLRRVR
jgi:hypothetical protein